MECLTVFESIVFSNNPSDDEKINGIPQLIECETAHIFVEILYNFKCKGFS